MIGARAEARLTTPSSAADLVGSLSDAIDATLAPLVPTDRPVALLDFPIYPNVGDSAIWLGALAALRRRGVRTLAYACTFKNYSRSDLARRIGDGTILLSGGGNFGDGYQPHQSLREDVIAAFPNNPIVQLPQSIWYRSREKLEHTRRILGPHRRLTLLLRDQTSFELARREFAETPSRLCPDLSLALGPLKTVGTPTDRIIWLSRADSESAPGTEPVHQDGVVRLDWAHPTLTLWDHLRHRIQRRLRRRPELMRWLYEPIAGMRLRRGIRAVSGGRVVITNRLHGHIVCLQLGIRHIVLPNLNGKVRAFYDTWTYESPITTWCDERTEALRLALELTADPDDGPSTTPPA